MRVAERVDPIGGPVGAAEGARDLAEADALIIVSNAEAQAAVNRYVRLRDAALPCISCQRHHAGKWNAGHYRSTAAAPELRFDLDNLHKQCEPCNTHLSGNLIRYRVGLLDRIGADRLAAIEGPHEPRKWTRDELIAMRQRFAAMAKELDGRAA